MTTHVGAPIKRKEDRRFVTGSGAFTDDLTLAGLAHAAVVRSPHAHARIRAIDTLAKYGLGTTITETDTEGRDVLIRVRREYRSLIADN